MPSDLEEAIVETAIAHILYQLRLRSRIAAVESFEIQLAFNRFDVETYGTVPEKSRIGGASPAAGIFGGNSRFIDKTFAD